MKHFEPFAASRGETVEACIAFVSADGTIKDDTLKAFNAFLLAAPARVSSSVYANCIKWMQRTLVLQLDRLREISRPRVRRPGRVPRGEEAAQGTARRVFGSNILKIQVV